MGSGSIKGLTLSDVDKAIASLKTISGYRGCCVLDADTGACISSDHEHASAWAVGNSEVYRAKMRAMRAIGMKEHLEEVMMTIASQYHLIRSMRRRPNILLYLVLERDGANLGMARYRMAEAKQSLFPEDGLSEDSPPE